MKPVVGVTSIPRSTQTAFARLPHETVPEMYLEALWQAGAAPVVIPVHSGVGTDVLLSRLDGVLLTGGGDVDPVLYGREQHPETYGLDPQRDRLEVDLVRGTAERDIPLLAICRGIQVMNVALGGTLVQDIATEVPEAVDHWDLQRWDEHAHPVAVEPGSRLEEMVGPKLDVNSMHHQAVEGVGPGVRAVARAPDGVIEAIDVPDLRFFLGVQWHAECLGRKDPSFALFRSFAGAMREGRS